MILVVYNINAVTQEQAGWDAAIAWLAWGRSWTSQIVLTISS